MKLVEYLKPISNASQRDRVLATMYFLEQSDDHGSVTAAEVKSALAGARIVGVKSWNVSAVLAAAGAYVDSPGKDSPGSKKWELTVTGRQYIQASTKLPSLAPAIRPTSPSKTDDVTQLRSRIGDIADAEARAYASEAVECLAIGAHRAAIVFMWVAAIYELQERIWQASSPAAITAAAQSHNPKAKVAKKRDDLVEYNEALLLQVGHDVGVLDKNEKTELGKALDLRNASGHPNKYRPREHKAKAHIEDLIGMLF